MKALIAHDTPQALLSASRRSKRVRTAHRLLAIRDIMLGRARQWVCKQYGINRENLRHWVRWYNNEGIAGLADAPRAGRPSKLSAEQLAALKARVSVPPQVEQDGVGRWRAADVQRLIKRDYGVEYRSISGVCQLLHRLEQAWISGRPKHPQQATDAVASFKKTSRPHYKKSLPPILVKPLNCGARMKPVSGKKAAAPTAGPPQARGHRCLSIRVTKMPISLVLSARPATVPSA